MPLLMCPNDDAAMQTLERGGVQVDMCPTCRGVWLDRGELEKLMAAAVEEGRASAPVAPAPQAYAPQPPQPQPQQYAQPHPQPQPWGGAAPQPYRDDRGYKSDKYRDDRHRDGDHRYKKKKRDSIFDIFD